MAVLEIKRLNLNRNVNVSSELNENGNASEVSSELTPWIEESSKEWRQVMPTRLEEMHKTPWILYLSGGEMWEGMAVSIMVGLLFGTVITLLFIPSRYSILFKVDYKGYEFEDSILTD